MLIHKILLKKLFLILNVQNIKDWKYSLNHPQSSSCEWKNIDNSEINPPSGYLWFKPSEINQTGWFLFGIKHKSFNKRAFGIFKSGKWGVSQGRPMYPARRRWRVLRIGRKRENYLELQMLDSGILIKELWLIPLIQFDALRRMKKRLLPFQLKSDKSIIKKNLIWKKYNQVLLNQKSDRNLFKYSSWIKLFEKNFYKKYINQKNKFQNNFEIQRKNLFKEVDNKKWVIYIENNDKLAKFIYPVLNEVISRSENPVIIYGDEDHIDDSDLRYSPHFKTAWNRELFLSKYNYGKSWIINGNYWNKAILYLKRNKQKISIFNIIIYIYNFLEREKKFFKSIIHIPLILYHIKDNYLDQSVSKTFDKDTKFIKDLIKKNPINFGELKSISSSNKGLIYNWALPYRSLLSIIIPTKDKVELLEKCIDSINKFKPGCDIEIFIVDNNSILDSTDKFLKKFIVSHSDYKKKVLTFPGRFNYSAINNYASKFVNGNTILLLNNDTEFLKPFWGYELSSYALRPNMGCIGAKLLYADQTIQHAGVLMGIGGVAGHAFKYFDQRTVNTRINYTQEYSAVTGACLAISKNNWNLLGGLDEKNLQVNYNDVDICLRAQEKGLKNVYLPQVELIHYESKTRGSPEGKDYRQWKKEYLYMKNKWEKIINNDPYYHPLLTLEEENLSISQTRKLNQLFR